MKASLKAVVLRRLRRSTSAAFIAGAPVNTVAPAVTGTTTEGSTLSTTDGTWTGTPTISFTYQWFDALLDGSGNVLTDTNGDPLGSPVSSATANTYVLPVGSSGKRFFCTVTATNGLGGAWKDSNVTSAITTGSQGAGDVVAGARMWSGLRAFTTASIGGNAIELRRDSDNTTQTFVTTSTTPGSGMDTAAINTFKGAANLFVRTYHDQTGNASHWTQTTNANQPGFSLTAGPGGTPAITFNGTSQFMQNASPPNGAVGSTISAVANSTYTAAQQSLVHFSGTGGDQQLGYALSGANSIFLYAGNIFSPITAADATYHAINAVFNGASSDGNVDGTATTGNAGTQAPTSTTIGLGATSSGGSQFVSGALTEVGYWNATAFTSTQSSNMKTNQGF
jgi:hypothetical protein